jgi:hypothetical protein
MRPTTAPQQRPSPRESNNLLVCPAMLSKRKGLTASLIASSERSAGQKRHSQHHPSPVENVMPLDPEGLSRFFCAGPAAPPDGGQNARQYPNSTNYLHLLSPSRPLSSFVRMEAFHHELNIRIKVP